MTHNLRDDPVPKYKSRIIHRNLPPEKILRIIDAIGESKEFDPGVYGHIYVAGTDKIAGYYHDGQGIVELVNEEDPDLREPHKSLLRLFRNA
jgi:hypothetical protein